MSRLPKLRPEQLDPDQRALYSAIAEGPRARGPRHFALTDDNGGLEGPFNAMLLSPGLGGALQELGAALRYRGGLSDRCREIAILVTAHAWASEFEIYAHEAVGRAAGLTESELGALRESRFDVLSDETERLVAASVAALASQGDLTDAEFASASALGEGAVFEFTTLVGYYATLALQLRVFRVGVPG